MSVKFSQRLELRQSQSLVMTPQLLQAIKLLQLSNIELADYIETELEKNPLLERAQEETGPVAPSDAPAPDSTLGTDADWETRTVAPERGEIDPRHDVHLDNVYPDDAPTLTPAAKNDAEPMGLSATSWSGVGGQGGDGEDSNLEAYVAAEISLHDHLTEQLHVATTDPIERMIGATLVDLVDEGGYIREPLADTAERLGVPIERVEGVLKLIQSFDPTGVGARDLADCLRLQLVDKNRYDPAIAALLDNLDLLARRDFASLRKICGVDDEDLLDMVADIKKLDPKPGLKFGGGTVQPVIPDVYVRRSADGSFMVELNSEALPRILVNQTYAAKISSKVKNDEEKSYVSEALQTANWLTKSLEQRAKTILKVASEIVRHQELFFTNGVEFLRPLNLKAVADAIQMHESTVSRVTSNKYIAAERGLFEMKYFFTASIASAEGGESHSAEAVRFRIKQMIDQESAENILSDDTIVAKLKDSGIDIARRTVAKYRDSLRIPSSVERRREKQSLPAKAS
ncbi:MAG: RNA polymerase factor sigma-54 [Alphaproteobacteria bacterium]